MTSAATRRVAPGVWLLAALAYLPALTAKPGRMPTDTKLYLYLDPGRLIADAASSWDVRQFAGWVPHQTIAYLWPSGPWFWTFDVLHVPDWVAHRLWIGTIVFAGGAGVRWAARHLGLPATASMVAGVVYATSPYVLPYVSRTSVMLLPWAGVGWLVGLTVRAAARSGWRDPALFALVVLTVGAVNAAALALIAPAPMLWLIHAAWQRTIGWRAAVVTAGRIGVLSLAVSMWWIVMLVVQGRHGADVLAFSETLDAVSLTSTGTETLRGLGYWLFYVRDPYAFTTTASVPYLSSVRLILIGYALSALCLAGLAITRWTHRRYAALLVFTGIVLAVGVHPIADSAPLMRPLRDSPLGLALRSSTRALPLSTFGMALGAGALVAAVSTVGAPSLARWRRLVAPGVVLLAIVNLPALWTGGFVDPALVRDQQLPTAWTDAVASLDAGSSEHRVLQLPGSEFGAFRWGYTVDPPLPGLTDKPLVTRDLLPLGSPGAMDLLYALDNRFQSGSLDPDSIAGAARFLGVDTIWVANDLAFDRFRTPRPELVSQLFATVPEGLSSPVGVGSPATNAPDLAMVDEQLLSESSIGTPLAPVELVEVRDAPPVVRVAPTVVELAGSGDGIVDAVAAGLLTGDEAVIYSADVATGSLPAGAMPVGAALIVTDSNRDRALQWRGSQDVTGLTEVGGAAVDAIRTTTADQRLAVFATVDEAEQTVARLDGGLVVRASGYGEPFAYRPEDRPAKAVDDDLSTAWIVGDRANPVGAEISVSSTDGTLTLVQPQDPAATRRISRIAVDDGTSVQIIDLSEASLAPRGQAVRVAAGVPVVLTIVDVVTRGGGTDSGPSGVGFAELGPVAHETTFLPTAALATLDVDRPVALVLTRDRVRATDRWRSDPEDQLVREFALPVARSGEVTATLRLSRRAPDALLAAIGGSSGVATSSARLAGVPTAGAVAALDGDTATAWTTPFGGALGSSITIPLVPDAPLGLVRLTQPIDGLHSRIVSLTASLGGSSADEATVLSVDPPDATGTSTIDLTGAPGDGITADSLTLTITGVEPGWTIDRRFAERVELPAAVSELTGLPVADAVTVPVAECRDDLITIDGQPVAIRFGPEVASRLLAGEAVDVAVCGEQPIVFGSGAHRVVSTPGIATGVDVDQIVIRSGISSADAAPGVAAGEQPSVQRTRTTRTATVAACPSGCWLILGEGYNQAWAAMDDRGADLGPPTQIAGGFNGWWLPPSGDQRTITMNWTPQRSLNLALGVAGLGVLACLALAVFSRRHRDGELPASHPRLDLLVAAVSPGRAAGAGVCLVVTSALVISPRWAALALVPAAITMVTRRPALLAWCAPALTAVTGLWVAWRQYSYRYPADAAWTGYFSDLHRPGVFVVVLLTVGIVFGHELGDDSADQRKAADTVQPAR